MDIILTISLLASNRRESLERCLDSLKPLLVKIPSELIIVVTGTDEKVLEIAQKYTPQVITFEWCDDFSAARNIGLKAAQGEWFLYIDDDEWFDNVEEICQFFLSGEYKHYHSAHYIQRNYNNWNGTKYSDFSAFRMVQRYPESRFQGAIHEELVPRIEPCKYLQTCVHHYGYVKDAENKNNQKTSRNIPMLLQAIEGHPKQVKNYIQITKEYDLAGDWKSAEEYCRKGAFICRESKDYHSYGWLQAYFSYLISKKPGNASAISEVETILAQESPTELICLVLYQHIIHMCSEEKETEKAVLYGRKFEKLLKEMDKKPFLWEQQEYGEFCENYIKSPEHLYGTRAKCITCALESHDWASAAYFLKFFPWDSESLLCRYYPNLELWTETYPSPVIEILLEILTDLVNRLGISDMSDIQDDLDSSIPVYLLIQKALDYLKNGNKDDGLNLFLYCILHTENPYLLQQLFKEGIRYQISIIPFVTRIGLDMWNLLVERASKELPFTLNNRFKVCEEEIANRYPIHSLCLKRYRLEQKLFKGFPLWDELITDLKEYCLCITEFYRNLYREEVFAAETNIFLPADCRFAQVVLEALKEWEHGQISEVVRMLGEAFHIYPDMTGVITEVFRQAARKLDDPALNTGTEFLMLANQMKETLRTLAETNEAAQACEILNQLLPLLPEDMELIWMRQELIRRKKS